RPVSSCAVGAVKEPSTAPLVGLSLKIVLLPKKAPSLNQRLVPSKAMLNPKGLVKGVVGLLKVPVKAPVCVLIVWISWLAACCQSTPHRLVLVRAPMTDWTPPEVGKRFWAPARAVLLPLLKSPPSSSIRLYCTPLPVTRR